MSKKQLRWHDRWPGVVLMVVVAVVMCGAWFMWGRGSTPYRAEIARHLCRTGEIPHDWGEWRFNGTCQSYVRDDGAWVIGRRYTEVTRTCKRCGLTETYVDSDEYYRVRRERDKALQRPPKTITVTQGVEKLVERWDAIKEDE